MHNEVDSEGEEDLDKVMDILLEKRKEVFEKVEKNSPAISKRNV